MEKLKKKLPLISAILAIISFAMLVVPAILNYYDPVFKSTDVFIGFQTVFGTHKDFYGTSVHVLRYSFWNLVPYLLTIVTAVFGFFNNKKLNVKTGIFSGACSLVAGVLFFLVLPLTYFDVQGATGVCIGPGAIIAGLCSILASGAIIYSSIVKIIENKKAKKAENEITEIEDAAEGTTEETVEETVEETTEETAEEVVEEVTKEATEIVEEAIDEAVEEVVEKIIEE
ncbi:MAG: hypothetical protein IJW54_05990 [Clostridia bacterium]|nr:hypothetical protein [Clostridia bacterium]